MSSILCALNFSAHAQFIPPPLSLTANPASPDPRSSFTVTASTPTFDKDTAFFEWMVDGKKRPEFSGAGANEISLLAGAVGSANRISVTAARSGQDPASASLTVIPSELSLPWIADTSVPAWYRGKALITPGADVSVVAVPRIIVGGATLAPENLIYRWSIDNNQRALAGAGKRVFIFRVSGLPQSTHQIDVSVEDMDGRIRKEGRALISTDSAPRLILYPSLPLGGAEQRHAGSALTRPGLFDIIAEPFFFPLRSLPSLAWSWKVNGADTPAPPETPRLITTDTADKSNQTVSISAAARSQNQNLFQTSYSGFFNLFVVP